MKKGLDYLLCGKRVFEESGKGLVEGGFEDGERQRKGSPGRDGNGVNRALEAWLGAGERPVWLAGVLV